MHVHESALLPQFFRAFNYSSPPSRRLLQLEVTQEIQSLKCSALSVPLQKIKSAFFVTASFYSDGISNAGNKTNFWYSFVDSNVSDNRPLQALAYKALSVVMSAGSVPGERILESTLSNLSYEECVNNDLFTGKRFLTDISSCNYTTLTFGPATSRLLLPWLIILLIVFYVISSLCSF